MIRRYTYIHVVYRRAVYTHIQTVYYLGTASHINSFDIMRYQPITNLHYPLQHTFSHQQYWSKSTQWA